MKNRIAGAAMVTGGSGGISHAAASTASKASVTSTASVARSTPQATTAVLRCSAQDLSASLHGAQTGRGYHVGFILTLTNTGQRSCSLYGYPGLGLQDWHRHAVPSHTFWGPTWFDRDPGRQLIVLSPGETASASLAWTSGALRGGAVDAAYLVVTPPDDYGHLVAGPFSRSMEIPVYHGDLYVTAMARHTPHP